MPTKNYQKLMKLRTTSAQNKLKTSAKILLATYPILPCQADTANSVSVAFWSFYSCAASQFACGCIIFLSQGKPHGEEAATAQPANASFS
jgi:hypothetical protein